MEWVFLVVYAGLNVLHSKNGMPVFRNYFLLSVLGILLVQTFWLLPGLIESAELIISGSQPEESGIHLYYIMLEIVKVALLILVAIRQSFRLLGR
jgi:hypothetical protein